MTDSKERKKKVKGWLWLSHGQRSVTLDKDFAKSLKEDFKNGNPFVGGIVPCEITYKLPNKYARRKKLG